MTNNFRKQIEERMEMQKTLDGLRNPADGETILLPIASRLKAASLPVSKTRQIRD